MQSKNIPFIIQVIAFHHCLWYLENEYMTS